ncbi:ROK family transcriptional regulator [Microbacterium halophytorum]|uniref:ROK family transcriptional regulator n=1 Tax=Microbacterium halophytorum TaxID=2067568 RepID=UPI000CFD486F|nr:ROK family protein [Microbacterium halophytorum]
MAGGASVEGVRTANLGAILRLVCHEGPLSRAELTQRTGLNRSTVGALVQALADRGLVAEREPDPTNRVGRPSPIVAARDDVVTIAINPEIDALEIGAVGLGGVVRARERIAFDAVPTPDDVVAALARAVDAWRSGALGGCRVLGIAAAVPGLVRASDGVVAHAPHLGWREVDLAGLLMARLGGGAEDLLGDAASFGAAAGNDASLGAVAERLYGAARGHDDLVYLNGGASGIGGGLIIAGRSVGGAGGFAGEWGQTRPAVADENDRRSPGGVLEDEVNRRRLFEALGIDDDDALAAALAAGPDAAEPDRQRRILAAGLANAANALNPSMIVLGGFLAALRGADAGGFDSDVRALMLAAPAAQLEVRAAALEGDRLLIGAAELILERLAADPLR